MVIKYDDAMDNVVDLEPPRLLARGRRKDPRSIATINRIMEVTEQLLLDADNEKLSILTICDAANISRGTFYRYFSSQEELLDLFTTFMRDKFYKTLIDAVASFDDPDEKFDAFIAYFDTYLREGKSRKFLDVAPDYALTFFKRMFDEGIQRFKKILEPVLDAWEKRVQGSLDRDLICEMLMRHILSEQLVPMTGDRRQFANRIRIMLDQVAGK